MAKIGMRGSIVAALAARGIIVAGGREAKAGLSSVSSLSITGGLSRSVVAAPERTLSIPTNSLPLSAGSTLDGYLPPFYNGPLTTITVGDFVSYAPTPTVVGQPEPFTFSGSGSDTFLPMVSSTNPQEVTWTLVGLPVTAPSASSLILGTFYVTTQNYANPLPVSLVTAPLTYTYSLDGGS